MGLGARISGEGAGNDTRGRVWSPFLTGAGGSCYGVRLRRAKAPRATASSHAELGSGITVI